MRESQIGAPSPSRGRPRLIAEIGHDRNNVWVRVESCGHLLNACSLKLHIVVEQQQVRSLSNSNGGFALSHRVRWLYADPIDDEAPLRPTFLVSYARRGIAAAAVGNNHLLHPYCLHRQRI